MITHLSPPHRTLDPQRQGKKTAGAGDLRNQYSINDFLTVPVVPSAMISKKDAHSPQLNASESADKVCSGLVRWEVARRPMRASASCWTVMYSVVK